MIHYKVPDIEQLYDATLTVQAEEHTAFASQTLLIPRGEEFTINLELESAQIRVHVMFLVGDAPAENERGYQAFLSLATDEHENQYLELRLIGERRNKWAVMHIPIFRYGTLELLLSILGDEALTQTTVYTISFATRAFEDEEEEEEKHKEEEENEEVKDGS